MLQEVKQAVVTFLVQLFAPPNNVNVLQVVNQGSVFLNFNVQVGPVPLCSSFTANA